MTDTDDEVARARAALGAPPVVADPSILGAVREGLLSVPVDPAERRDASSAPAEIATSSLAVRRR